MRGRRRGAEKTSKRDEKEFAAWMCAGGVERETERAGEESCDTRSQIDGQIDKTVSVRGARLH